MTTSTSTEDAFQPLGLGSIVEDAFKIFFRRFGLMFVLSLFPALIGLLVTTLFPPPDGPQLQLNPAAAAGPILVAWAANFLVSGLSNSLIVLAAFDTKIGRPGRLDVYVRWALMNFVTVIVMTVVLGLVMMVPAVLLLGVIYYLAASAGGSSAAAILVIPMIGVLIYFIYVWAAFSPLVPAIVVEGAGFRALGRAWQLTRGYRWRVVGVMLVLFMAVAVIGLVGSLIGRLFGATGLAPTLVSLAISAIAGGILAVGVVMIYARLRAIKEGLGVEALADVFR